MGEKENRIYFTINSPAKPTEAFIFVGLVGFFFYFSPAIKDHLIDFISVLGIYSVSLLGISFFQEYNDKLVFFKVFCFILFFLATVGLAYFFFLAFFGFLSLFKEYFQLNNFVVTLSYLGIASLTILAWVGIKKNHSSTNRAFMSKHI